MKALERDIFVAAYVREFGRLHDLGVHAQFRIDHPIDDGARVCAWEAWCADVALDEAMGVLQLFRAAKKRAGRHLREELAPWAAPRKARRRG